MRTVFLFFSVLFSTLIFAQKCEPPRLLHFKDFAVYMPTDRLKVFKANALQVYVKAPKKGKSINDSGFMQCDAWIPDSSSVLNVQIVSIDDLPKGTKWTSSVLKNNLKAGQMACVTISGIPKQKGIYPLKIKTTGEGRFLGVKKTVNCELIGFKLVVE